MMHHDDTRDDATLVALTLAGERAAFEPLLLRYYPSVARLARRLLGPTIEAQDVTQDSALQALLRLEQLHEPARFGAWLHAIAANLARMALRQRRHTLSLDALNDPLVGVERDRGPHTVLWAAESPSPEDVHAAREVHDAIVAALGELSLVNREAVIGFYLDGYTYVELAELLGVPVSTIKGRLFFGRRRLRRTLQPLADEVLRPDRRPRKERAMEASDTVAVKIDSIRTQPDMDNHRVVVLREEGADRILPIWIGSWEADAIDMAMRGQQPDRPMTHDLTLRLLESLGARVQHVVLTRLVENTFYADIQLAQDGKTQQVDARPSDALALAVRVGTPIYAARALFDAAGGPDDEATWADRAKAIQQFRASQAGAAPEALQSPTE